MTLSDFMWLSAGWFTGILTVLQLEVWSERRAHRRHPSQYHLRPGQDRAPGRGQLDEWDGL